MKLCLKLKLAFHATPFHVGPKRRPATVPHFNQLLLTKRWKEGSRLYLCEDVNLAHLDLHAQRRWDSMSSAHLSATPGDPYEWRESVLSTRSLSYLSTADMSSHHAPNLSLHRSLTRNSTEMTDDSDRGIEMANQDTELDNILELPDSVADSLLFKLPREIRDRLYGFCLTTEGGVPMEWPTQWKMYGLQPQLLRTCRTIYEEAAPLLYTLNDMTFHHPSDANMFVRAISSPDFARDITSLCLHIKAQDTRLWMPYLTSRDPSRSLKADFPSLRQLSIRFRSNKWSHTLPPEANLKIWSEDSRLDEIIDGLRHVFLPDGPINPKNEREFETYLSNRANAFPLDPNDSLYKKQWLAIHKARNEFARKQEAPVIKVTCACRVHSTHFAALTVPPAHAGPDLSQANNGTGVIQQTSLPPLDPPQPTREGQPFRGFTPADLRGDLKRLHDPDLGSATVAQTAFADKDGILISLEIHCLDPRRNNTAEPRPV